LHATAFNFKSHVAALEPTVEKLSLGEVKFERREREREREREEKEKKGVRRLKRWVQLGRCAAGRDPETTTTTHKCNETCWVLVVLLCALLVVDLV